MTPPASAQPFEEMMADGFICTRETPWRPGLPTPVIHAEVTEVSQRDGYPGGDIVTMQCAICGHRWEKELPQ